MKVRNKIGVGALIGYFGFIRIKRFVISVNEPKNLMKGEISCLGFTH